MQVALNNTTNNNKKALFTTAFLIRHVRIDAALQKRLVETTMVAVFSRRLGDVERASSHSVRSND